MKNTFILVYSNYDGTNVEKFSDINEMDNRVTNILKSKSVEDFGQRIVFAGSILQEFTFVPAEVVTKYKAVEVR